MSGILLAVLLAAGPVRADGQDKKTVYGLAMTAASDLASEPDSDGKRIILKVVRDALQKADEREKKEPGSRDETIRKSMDELNAAIDDLSFSQQPPQTRRLIDHSFAKINNAAGDFPQSVRITSRLIESDPGDRDAYSQRSNAYFGLGRYGPAFTDAQKAVALNPSAADGYTAKAMADYGLHRYQEASEEARRALALDAEDRTAFAILKLCEGKNPIKLDANSLQARWASEIQGEYHSMLQQLNQAEQTGQRLASSVPASAPADMGGKTPAASGESALVRQASGKLSLKDYSGAIEKSNEAIAKNPDNAAAYYYRATAKSLLGDYQNAAQDATRALMLSPDDIASRDTRAFALNHLGQYRDAIADSHHSLEIDPKDAYAYANLGYSRERMGDVAAMLASLKTAASLNPQFEPAYQDAAERYGLKSGEEITAPSSSAGGSPMAPESERRRSFVIVLLLSLTGGLLIALGLLDMLPSIFKKTGAGAHSNVGRGERGIKLLGKIGGGGMGIVYEGFDRALKRRVAVKAVREDLRLDAHARERLIEEARTTAALRHPAIVEIHSVLETKDGLYLVFEFVEGRTLAQLLAEKGRLTLFEARAIIKPICEALDYAHDRGVVHRDLKPSNVMIASDGAVKLMDFGISRRVKDVALQTLGKDGLSATPDYMAPEQAYGVIRAESDIFSLGICFYEMLTGRRPFSGGQAVSSGRYPKASSLVAILPPSIDVVLDAALHPDPARRLRSGGDFWRMLDQISEPIGGQVLT